MKKIAVIGLGYVGLPLAVEFGKVRPIMGFIFNPAPKIQAIKLPIERLIVEILLHGKIKQLKPLFQEVDA